MTILLITHIDAVGKQPIPPLHTCASLPELGAVPSYSIFLSQPPPKELREKERGWGKRERGGGPCFSVHHHEQQSDMEGEMNPL